MQFKQGDENWPVFFINFPCDREEYQPPAEINQEQQLTDHNLLIGERQHDLTIGDEPAIHIAMRNVQLSYPSTTFFFAHNGQLYSAVFHHTGNREDWNLYDHFLENIQGE